MTVPTVNASGQAVALIVQQGMTAHRVRAGHEGAQTTRERSRWNGLLRGLIFAVALSTPHEAHADEPTRVGFAAFLVDGVAGFTDPTMHNEAGLALLWGTRVVVGTKLPVGLEINYLGTERGVSIPGTHDGTLEGDALDAAIRFTLLPHSTWSPYGFGGVGWQRFDMVDVLGTPATMPIETSKGSIVFPVGGGIQIRPTPAIMIDVRGTYRISRSHGLVVDPAGAFAPMNAWETVAAIGLEI